MLAREMIAYGLIAIIVASVLAAVIIWRIKSPRQRFLRRDARAKKERRSERENAREKAYALARELSEDTGD